MDTSSTLLALLSSASLGVAVALGIHRVVPVWDQFAGERMGEFARRTERLSMPKAQVQWVLRWWGVALLACIVLLGVILRMLPVAAIMLVLIYIAPRHVLDYLILQRSRLLRRQMVGAAQALGNCVKAGLSLPQALEAIARETPEPLATEFRRIVYEYQRGRPLKDALEAVRNRLDLEPFTLFALAVEAAIERGGRLNEALARISVSLQESERLERKLEADTSSGRLVVKLLAGFPFFFLGFFSYADPDGVNQLLFSSLGNLVMCVMILLIYTGVRWGSRIMRIEV